MLYDSIFLADNRWLLFSRIPFRTLAFPWSPWRAGSLRRRSLPNGKRSRSSWWDWRKLRRKANPDTHTGHRPGQGSLIDARHYYWVPVRIISFVVLTHGATVTTPPPPTHCLWLNARIQSKGKSEHFSNWWFWEFVTDFFYLDVMDFQELRICLCYIVLYPIFEQISFNSDAVKEYNILKGACSYMYILCFVLDIFFVVILFIWKRLKI